MKKFNWGKAILFNIITFGVYSLYMWHKVTKNTNEVAKGKGINTVMSFIPALLLGYITCGIYNIVWYIKLYKTQAKIARASGVSLTPCAKPFVLLLLTCVPVYGFYVVCENNNRVIDAAYK